MLSVKPSKSERALQLEGYLAGSAGGIILGYVSHGLLSERHLESILALSFSLICLAFSYVMYRRFVRAKSQDGNAAP